MKPKPSPTIRRQLPLPPPPRCGTTAVRPVSAARAATAGPAAPAAAATLAALAALAALLPAPTQGQTPTEAVGGGGYVERIEGTLVTLDMLPLEAGDVQAGEGQEDDGPGLWMSRTEITWDLYDVFLLGLDEPAGEAGGADAISRPSKPYVLPGEHFGHEGHPVVGVTFHAARSFAEWLSVKTGRAYRLPTEEEWERACRAGLGEPDDAGATARRAWHRGNADGRTHAVGELKPDALGLHDLLGNAAEWVVAADAEGVVKGGAYRSDATELTCDAAARQTPAWQATDPQLPKSTWWLTDAPFVGFRVVREGGR